MKDCDLRFLNTNRTILEFGMDGEILSSYAGFAFAQNKTDASNLGGKVRKFDKALFVSDPVNKRAAIFDTITKKVIWEYCSDRPIIDFVPSKPSTPVNVSISTVSGSTAISPADVNVRLGQELIWKNSTSSEIGIYSGNVDPTDKIDLIDLKQHQSPFYIPSIGAGEKYGKVFYEVGKLQYFLYPSLTNGTIYVHQGWTDLSSSFYILETDGKDSLFGSRLVQVDVYGNTLWTFGDGYMLSPKEVQALLEDKALLSV